MRRLFDLFTKRRIVLVNREPSTLTVDEWRSEPALVSQARKAQENPTFRAMIDVLSNSNISGYQMPLGTPLDDRAVHQARGEGYIMCIRDLLSLAKYSKPREDILPTFEEAELPQETGVK